MCRSLRWRCVLLTVRQDIVTGDEVISDTYELIDKEDTVYEVDCKKITKGGESFDIGANPSAEEADEGLEDSKEQVIDVVHSFRLSALEGAFPTKKDYASAFKSKTNRDPNSSILQY